MKANGIVRCVVFFGACCMLNLALSAIAHLLHSKSQWHHFAFLFLDYMGVSIFIFGNGVVSMFICCSTPVQEYFYHWLLPVNVFLSWGACFVCVYAEVKSAHDNPHKKGMLLAGVVATSVLVSLPTAWRLVECALQPTCKFQLVGHLIIIFIMLTMCGVTFGCHFPESCWPGHFDVLGHGHQWFHLIVVLTMMAQVWGINADIHLDQRAKKLRKPEAVELVGFLVLLVIMETLMIIYFLRYVSHRFRDGQPHVVLKEETSEETPVDQKETFTLEADVRSFQSSRSNLEQLAKQTDEEQNG